MSYYSSSHPWLAIPYDDHKREELQSTFQVSGIPRLVILASTGRILVPNAVQVGLNIGMVDAWIDAK